MKKHSCIYAISFAMTALMTWVLSPTTAWAQEEFDELIALIEINATDGDAGFQAKGDAGEWREVQINSPGGYKLFSVRAFDGLREQGLTEFFSRARNPLVMKCLC